tara:strand:+ start:2653 stop:3096 length:444 start_codon:yes stop_codon:yes gene_type:complete
MKLVKEKFLDELKCREIIDQYIWNYPHAIKHRDTYALNMSSITGVTDTIESIAKSIDPSVKLDLCQVVKWPCNSKMDPHRDTNKNDVFAAIVYLNDNFVGGETCLEDFVCKPEIGKLLMFSNSELLHWVNQVTEGTRYTIALWFIRD